MSGRRLAIPIIFVTVHEEVIARVLADEAVACVPKPFGEDVLLTAVIKPWRTIANAWIRATHYLE
jgi:CheY-like chemotaxis protein